MNILDENTKIPLRSVIVVIAFVAAIVSGYFATLEMIDNKVSTVNNRVTAVANRVSNLETERKETKNRLDDLHSNQIKMMVALGVEPDPPKE